VPDALDQIRAGVERVVEVTDDQIEAAMRAIYDDTPTTSRRGAAASTVAALLSERDRCRGRQVAVVLTGANVDRSQFAAVLAGGDPGVRSPIRQTGVPELALAPPSAGLET
jgi:threonine dehydratase